jgi:hypothetical protein
MEAGGGAVAAPPKKGQLKDRPAAGRRGRKSVRTFCMVISVTQSSKIEFADLLGDLAQPVVAERFFAPP